LDDAAASSRGVSAAAAPDGGTLVTATSLLDSLGEVHVRTQEVLAEYAARPPSPDGEPLSVFLAIHPDPGRA
jgi:hypothetical protein